MKTFFVLFVLISNLSLALGHGNHPKPIANCAASLCTEQEIRLAIPSALSNLNMKGKIPTSWINAKIEKVELKEFKKGPEWMVTIFDENTVETSKQRLYVFITRQGFLNGANFTGE